MMKIRVLVTLVDGEVVELADAPDKEHLTRAAIDAQFATGLFGLTCPSRTVIIPVGQIKKIEIAEEVEAVD